MKFGKKFSEFSRKIEYCGGDFFAVYENAARESNHNIGYSTIKKASYSIRHLVVEGRRGRCLPSNKANNLKEFFVENRLVL